jgi:hypothetical protein
MVASTFIHKQMVFLHLVLKASSHQDNPIYFYSTFFEFYTSILKCRLHSAELLVGEVQSAWCTLMSLGNFGSERSSFLEFLHRFSFTKSSAALSSYSAL